MFIGIHLIVDDDEPYQDRQRRDRKWRRWVGRVGMHCASCVVVVHCVLSFPVKIKSEKSQDDHQVSIGSSRPILLPSSTGQDQTTIIQVVVLPWLQWRASEACDQNTTPMICDLSTSVKTRRQ